MRTRIATVLAVLMVTGFLPGTAHADPAEVGRWSAPFWEGGDLPFDPPSLEKSRMFPTAVSAVVLPDGRLLYWNGIEGSENGELWVGNDDGTAAMENSRSRLLDLRSGEPQWTVPELERGTTDQAKDQGPYSTKDMFCADQKLLYDGTVLISGGTEVRVDMYEDPLGSDVYGDDEARIFDPDDDAFRPVGQMHEPRWYPAMVTLPDGRVMIASGLRRLMGTFAYPDHAFSQVRLTEVYDPVAKTWEEAGTSDWSFPLYPRMHLLPDGKVFYGGSGQTWGQFGETADMATWAQQRVYDPATETWAAVGNAKYGVRGAAASTLLRLEPPYDSAEILLAGGTLGPSPSSWVGTTLSEIVRWTWDGVTNDGSIALPLAGLAGDATQLRSPRWFGSTVMLPTGEVLLLNGGDMDDVVDPGAAAAVRTPELYDPETGTWQQVATSARDRVYHNSAVLLPDGRVLISGNAPHPAHYTRHDNPATRSNNFRDATFEIYEPPYLFRGDRPELSSVEPADGGRSIELTFGGGTAPADISEVVLVRLGATTHTVDADMRAVVLPHEVGGAGVVASLPNGAVLPPGPYHVFAMRDTPDGPVPSIAQTVLIQPDTANGGVVASAP